MKCVKCGAELKKGCIYCSVCGNEAQMVSDYSVLEDDYLRSLLKEEEATAKKNQSKSSGESNSGKNKGTPPAKKNKNSRMPILIICILLVICMITGISAVLIIRHKNANSYEYQMKTARQECVDKNYETALQYYKTALTLKPDDTTVRLEMAEIYIAQAAYDEAVVLLTEVIEEEPGKVKAYEGLIRIYEAKKDYDSIVALASEATDANVLKLFLEYQVAAPIISPTGGEYNDFLEVAIFSMDGFDIYYTVNGGNPTIENGIHYDINDEKEIFIDKTGKYFVRAVCVNDKGIYSEIAEATYNVRLLPPKFARVFPDGGQIADETTVTIAAENDCSIYYTWDGTDPTPDSLLYQEPLEIPVGNNILSVLVVNNKTGLDSGVYRTNFIYYP